MKIHSAEVYGFYRVIRAIYLRKGHLLSTSTAAEFIDGFDRHTMESVFGENYEKRESVYNAAKNSIAGELWRATGRGADYTFDNLVYAFLTFLWYDCKKEPFAAREQRIAYLIEKLEQMVDYDEPDTRGARQWLNNLLAENGLR